MVMQDQDFNMCLKGLGNLRTILSFHSIDYPSFYTYCAILLEEPGVIERILRIIVVQEGELGLDVSEDTACLSSFFCEENEPSTRLISAKLESISILINLSFGSES